MLSELDDVARSLAGLAAPAGSAGLADHVEALDDDTVSAVVARLAAIRTAVDALWLAALTTADQRRLHSRHGARDVASWASALAGERRGALRRDVELARELVATPIVSAAVAAGDVSKAKAAELVRAATLPDEAQRALVQRASGQSVEQVARAVEQARLGHGIEPLPVVPAFSLSRHSDRATLEGSVDLLDAEIIDVAVVAAADSLDLPVGTPMAERRARGLTAVCRYFIEHRDTATTRLGRPHVLALVDVAVLEARTGGSATLGSGTVISGDQVRRLAEDANITRVITKGRSEPLDVGRTTRSVPTALAKAVIVRDRHCRYVDCHAPPWACDIHHRVPWARGGPTSLPNLGLLCWYHHDRVHRGGAEHLVDDGKGGWTMRPFDAAVAA